VMFIVKKCKLFEGVSPSSCILDECSNCAQNGHEVNKIDFLRVHQVFLSLKFEPGAEIGQREHLQRSQNNI